MFILGYALLFFFLVDWMRPGMASPLMEWFPFIPRLAFSFLQTQVLISLVPGPVRKEVYAATHLPDLLLAPLNGVYFFFLRRATLPCYARFRLAWRRCCEASPIENRGAESLKSSQSGTEWKRTLHTWWVSPARRLRALPPTSVVSREWMGTSALPCCFFKKTELVANELTTGLVKLLV